MSDTVTSTETDAVLRAAEGLRSQAEALQRRAEDLSEQAETLAEDADAFAPLAERLVADDFVVVGLTVFVLACFVGYYVVWRVTPALHSPLMSVTNAISSVIIVGALIAAGPEVFGFSSFMGFLAVILAAINIFGGFIVTQRMLQMFRRKGE
jgi:NAD(P) transhydrogenase subunit alpha